MSDLSVSGYYLLIGKKKGARNHLVWQHEDEPARGGSCLRAAHDAAGPSGLPLHRAGDVAQDSGSPSDVGRVWQVYRLEELSPGPIAVRDADGV